MKISLVDINEYVEVVEVWEASVRATHHFLSDDDIKFLKPLILNEYPSAVELRCVKDTTDKIKGFLGVSEGKIEMLFISPENRGTGVGKLLLNYAVNELGATKVDVNEQNPQAIGFYEHLGFKVTSRSSLDGMGKPFPLLHMQLCNL